ncbi:MAG TPA: SRPBCC domain-containing protein [Puia sp.]|nr:SRPBCC domain-containing protein [Puia sp.]
MPSEIKQTWRFSRSQEEVWEYLTRPELLALWLAKMDFEPVVGHRFHVHGKDGCLIECEVLEVRPFSRLAYSWRTASVVDRKSFDSMVVWTLVPDADGTELRLVHNGFAQAEDHAGHHTGWALCVGRVVEMLKGQAV